MRAPGCWDWSCPRGSSSVASHHTPARPASTRSAQQLLHVFCVSCDGDGCGSDGSSDGRSSGGGGSRSVVQQLWL